MSRFAHHHPEDYGAAMARLIDRGDHERQIRKEGAVRPSLAPAQLLRDAEACLAHAEATDSSVVALHLMGQAEDYVERASEGLSGALVSRAGVVAEHIRVAASAFPSGASVIDHVRALRDAMGEAA